MKLERIVGQGIVDLASCRAETEQQHGQHRPGRAQRDQTEAVLARVAAAEGLCDADAERHDEGNGDRPGRDAAGVEGERQERLAAPGDQHGREGEEQHVEKQQHRRQIGLGHDADDREREEQPHANADCDNEQRGIDDGADLSGQNGEIRLGHRDQHAHEKADHHEDAQLSRLGQTFADMAPHGRHGEVGAEIEQSDPQHQHQRADEEHRALQPGQRGERGKGKNQHKRRYRQYRNERF